MTRTTGLPQDGETALNTGARFESFRLNHEPPEAHGVKPETFRRRTDGPPPVAALKGKVQRTATCWLWTGAVDKDGYGRILRGPHRARRVYLAHRIAFEQVHGPIPAGKHVLHCCDTPRCVNPSHLFLGSHAANMRDRNEKRRQARGERNGRAKVTADDVLVIRMRRSLGESLAAIAADYPITPAQVDSICRRRTWKAVA